MARIERVETIRLAERPNLCYVQVFSDDGAIGLGETYFGAAAVEAHVHDALAPVLLGEDPDPVRRHHRRMTGYIARSGTGAEARAIAATDIALWDLLGKRYGRSIAALLGGPVRDGIAVYNTCAGAEYLRRTGDQHTSNWDLAAGRYEDLEASLTDMGALAGDLLSMGIRGMKVWPFDPIAERSDGHVLAERELEEVVELLGGVRRATGDQMALMIELHGLWVPHLATRIAAALKPLRPTWIEDPVRAEDTSAMATVTRGSPVPVAAGETLGSFREHRELVERGGVDVLIADVGWARGITEVLSIAELTRREGTSLAFHDCTGPVSLAVAVQLCLVFDHVPVQEIVRAGVLGWYRTLTDYVPDLVDGTLRPLERPGHGVELRKELLSRPDTRVRVSRLSNLSTCMVSNEV